MTQAAAPHRLDSFGHLRLERQGAVAILTLDRPEGRNSFDLETDRALLTAVRDLDADPALRVVVVTGAGKWFCTGADVAEMRENLDRLAGHFDELTLTFHAALATMRASRKVFVAAVNGVAAGGGVGLALACDFVVAARSARFLLAYANLGITPDGGTTMHLVRAVGPYRAREAILLAEGLDAETFQAWGLANRVVPDDEVLKTAREVAERLAARAPATLAETKRLVEVAGYSSVYQSLEEERRALIRAASGGDAKEGVTAFFEKRRPEFLGP